MADFRQMSAIVLLNLRHLPQRLGTSLVIVVGIAGVVGVLISVLAMANGLLHAFTSTGRPDRAIVLSMNAVSEAGSRLPRDEALAVMDAPGVKRDNSGAPIASAEAVVVIPARQKDTGSRVNVTLRGVGPEAFALRPEIRLVEGRMFRRAVHELIVGRAAQARFAGLTVGDHIVIRGTDWRIVGSFATRVPDSHDSELLGDAETVLSATRSNQFQSVTVALQSSDAFTAFKKALTSNPLLSVAVMRESEYFASQSKALSTVLFVTAYGVGGVMAIGALFGALNTMYSAVGARSREIATLRAIGFGAGAVVTSVLVEALLLALVGAIAGAFIATMIFNGSSSSTIAGGGSQLVYSLSVGPRLIGAGILWACAIGLLGGLFPAVRAARLSIATALRAI